jgi:AcrR family transcriptional regulator
MDRAHPRKRAPSRRRPLTRDRIVEAALALIDRDGLDALSMRALGAALHVEAMALYHWFASKGAVLDAVAEALMLESDPPGVEVADPYERIRIAARRYRLLAVQHPRAFVLVTTRRLATEASFTVLERILAPFFEAGFDAEMAARMFRLVGYFAGGAGHAEIASRAAQDDPTPLVMESFRDPARFPGVTAAAPHLQLAELDGVFEDGLDRIIDAVRRAPRRRSTPA